MLYSVFRIVVFAHLWFNKKNAREMLGRVRPPVQTALRSCHRTTPGGGCVWKRSYATGSSAGDDLDSLITATRRRSERRDSVDETILMDRALHKLRMEEAMVDKGVLADIKRLRLGRRKGWHSQKRVQQMQKTAASKNIRPAVELGKVNEQLSDFRSNNREGLPEIALFGHSVSSLCSLTRTRASRNALPPHCMSCS